jgi:repressor LexA
MTMTKPEKMQRLSQVIPNRIRALRADRGWSLQTLADKAGTTRSQIQKLETSQRRLDFDWIERLAKAFEITEGDLIGAREILPTIRMVPLLGDIAAGNWREAVAHAEGSVPAVGVSTEAFALRAKGDSMDLVVPDGGYVFVDPTLADLRDGKVFAVMNSENETTIKRFRADPARLEPCSTNPSHELIMLGRTPFTVIGQVTGSYNPL